MIKGVILLIEYWEVVKGWERMYFCMCWGGWGGFVEMSLVICCSILKLFDLSENLDLLFWELEVSWDVVVYL